MTGIAADDDDGNSAAGNSSIQSKQQELVNYSESLQAAKTVEQLGKVWATIPKDQHPKFLKIKDGLKAKLTPNQEVA